MKAYKITDRNGIYDYATVVFAETRNKAKAIAKYTDTCAYSKYVDICATRIPVLDSYYRGLSEMDWNDSGDRIAMVKHAHFTCSYEDDLLDECDSCAARQWCDRYIDKDA